MAANILLLLLLVLPLWVTSVIILIVLALMLTELAAGSVLGCLAAAPPHLATPVALMRAA